jgi:glucan phosphoethanolaminetransferase (alkaline phosphatase superfamily)
MFFHNIIFTVLISISLIIPDVILGTLLGTISSRLSLIHCIGILGFSAFLSFVRNKKFIYALLGLIFFIQAVQINHWLYFGLPIHATDINKVFTECDEIFLSGSAAFYRMWPGWASLIFMGFLQLTAILTQKKRVFVNSMSIWLTAFLMMFPLLLFYKGPNSLPLYPSTFTLIQSYRSFCLWSIFEWQNAPLPSYEPYTFKVIGAGYPNIIFIMGESTNTRYSSLYGYNQKNTPFLDSLDPNHFSYTKGISCSTSTKTSLPLFFNLVREPQNLNLIHQKTVNLFKLAKLQGYQTIYITGQNPKLFSQCGTEYVDVFVDLQHAVNTEKEADYILIEALKNISLKEKNFVVVHLRHIHSPYDAYVQKDIPFQAETTEKLYYTHAIRWHDQWLEKFLTTVNSKFPENTVTLYTSDHGELLGEENLFGHTIVHPLVSDVPVWAYSKILNPILSWIKENAYISHYELGIKIAELLGVKIYNPNDDEKTYYLQGANLYCSDFQFLPWVKQANKVSFLSK